VKAGDPVASPPKAHAPAAGAAGAHAPPPLPKGPLEPSFGPTYMITNRVVNLADPGGRLATALGIRPLAGSFLFSVCSFALAAAVIGTLLRPDPLLTARRLAPRRAALVRHHRRSASQIGKASTRSSGTFAIPMRRRSPE